MGPVATQLKEQKNKEMIMESTLGNEEIVELKKLLRQKNVKISNRKIKAFRDNEVTVKH